MSTDRKWFRLGDGILIAVILLICAGIYWFAVGRNTNERIAKIIYDGQMVREVDLSNHHGEEVIELMSDDKVTILVQEDTIGFIEHRCPDGLCEKTGMIKNPMQTAICLPFKVSIVIEQKNEEPEYDAIAG